MSEHSSSDDEKPVSPQVPASRAPATTLQGRDTYTPATARAPASRAPATMLQGRDTPAQSTRAPASRAPATMLQGRDAPAQSTRAPASRAPATMLLGRDQPVAPPAKVLDPSIFASKAPAGLTSVFISQADLDRAMMQTQLELLPEDEREKQEAWAQEQIKKLGFCPEGYKFIRIPHQGYQCKGQSGTGGAHGISDELLAEGKGGLLAIRNNKDEDQSSWTFGWDRMEGPYYPVLGMPRQYALSTTMKTKKELERDEADRKRRLGL